MSHKKTLKEYIKDFRIIHGDKYDYPNQPIPNGNRSKIKIICPEHGEFIQEISAHKSGQGCPDCAKLSRIKKRKLNSKNFIEDARKVHGDKYDYSLVDYKSAKDKVKIICPEHGTFEQKRNNHIIQKQGCPKCGIQNRGNSRSISKDTFIKKCREVHGDTYDYSLVDYLDTKTRVTIICKDHGEFETIPYNHLNGAGCKKCNCENNALSFSKKDEYLNRVSLLHNNKYNYPYFENEYINNKSKLTIICSKHGEYKQIAKDHMRGCGCPKCGTGFSRYEEFIKKYLEKNNIKFIERDRNLLKPYELDFVLPDYELAIEINGVYWHGEQSGKDKYYHKTKTDKCNELGYRLIHLFEDDMQKERVITSKLDSLLNINKKTIYGRKCVVREIDPKVKSKFLNKYHLQGNCKSDTSLGLFYKNKLISVMTFGKNRSQETELNRFCSVFNFKILGAAGKLFKYYIRNYKYDYIVSYADLTLSVGGMYYKLGFERDISKKSERPDYKYYNRSKSSFVRIHKSKFRRSELKKELDNFDESKSEWENMKDNGWDRIWDCGKMRMVYQKIPLTPPKP